MDTGTRRRFTVLGRLIMIAAVVVLLGLMGSSTAQAAPTVQRPISDFLDTQGTFCFDDGSGGCLLFVPPIENFVGWGSIRAGNWVNFVSIDYAGLANQWIEAQPGNVSLGTQFDGTIVERPLPDGRADVTVVLHTTNALTWVVAADGDFATGTLLFGHRASDVLDGADAALGDSLLQVSFINTAPGDPIPDLMQLFFDRAPGQELHQFVFQATAHGTLRSAFGVPDGTPGRVTVAQTSNVVRSNVQAAVVNLRKTGQ